MVRVIMAVLGILIIVLGSLELGVLLLLPAVITIFIKITTAIQKKKRNQRLRENMERKEREEKLAEERRKLDLVNQQNNLIDHYKNSPLLKDVANTISGGIPYSTPEEIIISNNWISGSRQGKVFTYDFAANRVHSFGTVIKVIHDNDELKYVVRPQMAMAEALNFLFDNKFVIYDNAKRHLDFHTDSDGDSHTTITYTSDHVKMVLASTLPNKSF